MEGKRVEEQALLPWFTNRYIHKAGVGSCAKTKFNMNRKLLKQRIEEFMEQEARSCSMDYGCVTPLYVYRSWDGKVAIEDIATGLAELRDHHFICD